MLHVAPVSGLRSLGYLRRVVPTASTRSFASCLCKPYITNKIFVSNVSGQKIQCFVSKFSGDGSDAWYVIGSNFENHGWSRSAWEVVVFRNEPDTKRVGFYLDNTKRTTKITFRSFTDVDIAHSE